MRGASMSKACINPVGHKYHRVTVNADGSNATDEQPSYSASHSDVFCNVTDVGGLGGARGRFRGMQIVEGTDTVVEFDENDVSGITPAHTITFGTRTLEIKHLVRKESPQGFPAKIYAHCSEEQ